MNEWTLVILRDIDCDILICMLVVSRLVDVA